MLRLAITIVLIASVGCSGQSASRDRATRHVAATRDGTVGRRWRGDREACAKPWRHRRRSWRWSLEEGLRVPVKAEPAVMDQVSLVFYPSFLIAQAGQTVEFQNGEDVLHNIRVTEVGGPEARLQRRVPAVWEVRAQVRAARHVHRRLRYSLHHAGRHPDHGNAVHGPDRQRTAVSRSAK